MDYNVIFAVVIVCVIVAFGLYRLVSYLYYRSVNSARYVRNHGKIHAKLMCRQDDVELLSHDEKVQLHEEIAQAIETDHLAIKRLNRFARNATQSRHRRWIALQNKLNVSVDERSAQYK